MTVIDLIGKIRSQGIKIQLLGKDLKIHPNGNPVSPALLDEIRQHKAGLINYFSSIKKDAAYTPLTELTEERWYETSHTQQRMWYTSHTAANLYNIPLTYIIEGEVDVAAYQRVFHTLVERHESLRTVFRLSDGVLKQRVQRMEDAGFEMEVIDLRDTDNARKLAQDLVADEYSLPFDLGRGVCRGKLLYIEKNVFLVVFTVHHISSDGWSNSILLSEAAVLYEAYRQGRPNPLPALRIQYKDYCEWLHKQLSGDTLKGLRDYWHTNLAGPLPQHQLISYHQRPAMKTYNGSSLFFKYDKALSQQLRALSAASNVTLFITCVSVLKLMFYKYTGQTDLIFGTVSAGRNHPDVEGCVGLFLDTLALRTKFSDEYTFEQLIAGVRDTTLEAYEHQLYPFDMLVKELVKVRDPARMPVYDIFVLMQNFADAALPGAAQTAGSSEHNYFQFVVEHKSCNLDLEFFFSEEGDQLCLNLNYNTDLFIREQILQFSEHFQQLCRQVCINPQQRIARLEMITARELQQINDMERRVLDRHGNPCPFGVGGNIYEGTHNTGQYGVCHATGEIKVIDDDAGIPAADLHNEPERMLNPLEIELREIWEDVLQHNNFSVSNNFFTVGGHSLKLMELSALIEERIGIKVPLGIFFQETSITSLAGWISAEKSSLSARSLAHY